MSSFRDVVSYLRIALRREQQLQADAERKTLVGLHTAAGSAVAAGMAIIVDVITKSQELGMVSFATLLPITLKLGQLLGLRAWDKRVKQLAAAPSPINERQLARDEFRQELDDIELLKVPPATRVKLQEIAYARHLSRLDAIEPRMQTPTLSLESGSPDKRAALATEEAEKGYMLPSRGSGSEEKVG